MYKRGQAVEVMGNEVAGGSAYRGRWFGGKVKKVEKRGAKVLYDVLMDDPTRFGKKVLVAKGIPGRCIREGEAPVQKVGRRREKSDDEDDKPRAIRRRSRQSEEVEQRPKPVIRRRKSNHSDDGRSSSGEPSVVRRRTSAGFGDRGSPFRRGSEDERIPRVKRKKRRTSNSDDDRDNASRRRGRDVDRSVSPSREGHRGRNNRSRSPTRSPSPSYSKPRRESRDSIVFEREHFRVGDVVLWDDHRWKIAGCQVIGSKSFLRLQNNNGVKTVRPDEVRMYREGEQSPPSGAGPPSASPPQSRSPRDRSSRSRGGRRGSGSGSHDDSRRSPRCSPRRGGCEEKRDDEDDINERWCKLILDLLREHAGTRKLRITYMDLCEDFNVKPTPIPMPRWIRRQASRASYVTCKDFISRLRRYGVRPKDAEMLFNSFNVDDLERVNFEDFLEDIELQFRRPLESALKKRIQELYQSRGRSDSQSPRSGRRRSGSPHRRDRSTSPPRRSSSRAHSPLPSERDSRTDRDHSNLPSKHHEEDVGRRKRELPSSTISDIRRTRCDIQFKENDVLIRGRVLDCVHLRPVRDAKLQVRELSGKDKTTQTVHSEDDGYFDLRLDSRVREIAITCQAKKYETCRKRSISLNPKVKDANAFVMFLSPELDIDDVRIVLTWTGWTILRSHIFIGDLHLHSGTRGSLSTGDCQMTHEFETNELELPGLSVIAINDPDLAKFSDFHYVVEHQSGHSRTYGPVEVAVYKGGEWTKDFRVEEPETSQGKRLLNNARWAWYGFKFSKSQHDPVELQKVYDTNCSEGLHRGLPKYMS